MSIEFYNFNNTNYENDGDVTLAPSKAIFKIKMNGICEIEIDHPYDKEGRWKIINKSGVIKAPTPYSNGQLFGIYGIKKNMLKTGITIQARHIFFDLVHTTVDDIRAVDKNGQDALNILLQGTKFTGHSNISASNTCYFVRDNIVSLINSDKDNTFIKRWGGEIFLDNYDVYINDKIGGNYGARVSYGINMLDLGIKENNDNIVTRIKPIAYNGRTLPNYGYVDSPLINKYRIIYEKFIQMDNLKLKSDLQDQSDDSDDGSILFDTEEELYQAMKDKCNELFENGIDKPEITGNIKVAPLENSEFYKDIKGLVNISLGDTVVAHSELLDIDMTTRCIGYEWNILTKKYNSIEIGDVVKNYFENQSDISNAVSKVLNGNGNVKTESLEGIINGLKTKFQAQRDIAQPQQVRAMLFEDKIKGSSTYGALSIGSMGLEIASERTPDDKDWNWQTFITGSQVVADYLIGKLKTVLIENADGSFKIDLNEPGGAKFFTGKDLSLKIENNTLQFFNWKHQGEKLGFIGSTIGVENNIGYLNLINNKNNVLAISYENNHGSFTPYITFDKYNIEQEIFPKPIQVWEESNFNWKHLYRAQLANDDDSGCIFVDNDRGIFKYKDYIINATGDSVYVGKANTGPGINITDNGIYFHGQLYKDG